MKRRPTSPNSGPIYGVKKVCKPLYYDRVPEGDSIRGWKAAATRVSAKAAKEKPFLVLVDPADPEDDFYPMTPEGKGYCINGARRNWNERRK